jgi:hypothetical protein
MYTTIKDKKLSKTGCLPEEDILRILYPYGARRTGDFYITVVKGGVGLVKVSYNYRLDDPLKIPIGEFDITGMVMDADTLEILYPGMKNPAHVTLEEVPNFLDDRFLRCEGWINPPECSPLLTLFCDPRDRAVYVQYESSRIVKRINHALDSVPEFANIFRPVFEACAEIELGNTVEETVFLALFDRVTGVVVSVRCVWENGEYPYLYVERSMVHREGVWTCLEPGFELEWVDVVFGTRTWPGLKTIQYPSPLTPRVIRIVPEESDTRGIWRSYVYIAPSYEKQLLLQLTPLTHVSGTKHFLDEDEEGGLVGNAESRELTDAVDDAMRELLKPHSGVWFHWNNIGFPVLLISGEETMNRTNVYSTDREKLVCSRLRTYYRYTPLNFRPGLVREISQYFADRALLCNKLYTSREFSKYKSPGIRKFTVARYVSEMSWGKIKTYKIE